MKIIITGGTGMVGSALARAMAPDGHEIVVLTRDATQKTPNLPASARLVEWDAKTVEGWSGEVDGADAIVNLAGANLGPEGGLWTTSRKKTILQSRLDATGAVVDALRRADQKPRVLVQGSAVGYYGVHEDELITEGAPPGTDFLAQTVKKWEAASAPVDEMGVRRVCSRMGLLLTRKGGSLPFLVLPYRLFVGGRLGSGKQYYSWIHLEDAAGAIRFLIENEATEGAYNLTAPNPLPQKEFGAVISKVLSRPNFFPTPGFALRLVFQEMSIVVLEGQRVLPTRLQEAGYEFHFPNLEGALRDLY